MGGKGRKKEKLEPNTLEVPRAQTHSHPSALKVRDQFVQPRLGLLLQHGGRLDGADGGLGFVLRGLRQGMDVVEDVGGFADAEHFSAAGIDGNGLD